MSHYCENYIKILLLNIFESFTSRRPQHSRCAYCDINYDFIGRAETFDQDRFYVSQVGGITQELGLNNEKSRGKRLNVAKRNVESRLYFDQLSQGQKEKLVELYKMDFELFGYDPKPYL